MTAGNPGRLGRRCELGQTADSQAFGSVLAPTTGVKRVLVVVIDGWTPRVFAPALDRGDLDHAGRDCIDRDRGVSLRPRVGRIFATAKTGFEFSATGQSVHRGAGSHGTLQEDDSRVPLLVAGAPGFSPPHVTPRIIDVLPICSEILSLQFAWQPGQSRSAARL